MSNTKSPSYLLWMWDAFRWRFLAVYGIIRWLFMGLPVETFGGELNVSRWHTLKSSWGMWRTITMDKHERHKRMPLDEFISQLRK